ncbi:MAG: NTP transferase domain-containing protein [Candidatus Omnitrophota bacterium]|nr:NTP transferase domain-containing protein [Candidatus Omnitrophota bacterium]
MNTEKNKLFGLILAGGRSRRMGQDKALMSYHGKPQVEYVRDLLKEFCAEIFISGRSKQGLSFPNASVGNPEHTVSGPPIKTFGGDNFIEDMPSFAEAGPLTGILSAMTAYPGVSWLVMACDLPFADEKTLRYLIKHRDPAKAATAFISTHDGLPEPLCAIWEAGGYEHFISIFKQGARCPRKTLAGSDTHLITQQNPRWLDNVNTPEEYRQALRNLDITI